MNRRQFLMANLVSGVALLSAGCMGGSTGGGTLEGDATYSISEEDLSDDMSIDGSTELQFDMPRMSPFSLSSQNFENYSTQEITGWENDQSNSESGQYVLDAGDGTPNAFIEPSRTLDGEKITQVEFTVYVDADFVEELSSVNLGWVQISTTDFELVDSGFRSMSFSNEVASGIAETTLTIENDSPEQEFSYAAGVGAFEEGAIVADINFDTDAPVLSCFGRM